MQHPIITDNLLEADKKGEVQLQLRNRFQILADLGEDTEVETHWKRVKEVFTTTCKEVLGEKKREHKEWISQYSLDLITKRRKLKLEVVGSRTRGLKSKAQELYRMAAKDTKRSIKKDKEEFTNSLAEKVEKEATGGHMRILYQTTKTLAGKYGKPYVPVKDKDGCYGKGIEKI